MDIGPNLSEDFFDISPEVVEIDFRVEKRAFRTDDECASQGVSRIIVIDAELTGQGTCAVGAHREFDFFEHLFVPLRRR